MTVDWYAKSRVASGLVIRTTPRLSATATTSRLGRWPAV